jgi:hypothetical protein
MCKEEELVEGLCPECQGKQLLIDQDEEIVAYDDLTEQEIAEYDREINELEEEIRNCCG